jgi:hypothetical protein
MKHCPKCKRAYVDSTLNFCLDDGSQLSPLYDTEAETLKTPPKKPELSPEDVIMEVADYLRHNVRPGKQVLIRFEQITGLTPLQVSEHFEAAAQKAKCVVIDKSDTRATVKYSTGIVA